MGRKLLFFHLASNSVHSEDARYIGGSACALSAKSGSFFLPVSLFLFRSLAMN